MIELQVLGTPEDREDPIWWPAVVVVTDDPEWRGRIKARVFGLDTEIITEGEREGIKHEHLPWYEQVCVGGSGITHMGKYGDIPVKGSLILVSWLDKDNKQMGVYWGHAPRSITDKLPNKDHGFSDPDELYPRHDRRGTSFQDGIGSTPPIIDYRKRLKFPAYNGALAAYDVLIPPPASTSTSSGPGAQNGSSGGGETQTTNTSQSESSAESTPIKVIESNAQRSLDTEWANNILEKAEEFGDTLGEALDSLAVSAGLDPKILNSPLETLLKDLAPAFETAKEAIEKALKDIMGPCVFQEIQKRANTIANAATDLIRDTLIKSGCPLLQEAGKDANKVINEANQRVQGYVGEVKSAIDNMVGNPRQQANKALREATDIAFNEVNEAISQAVEENPIVACVIDVKSISAAVNASIFAFSENANEIISKALPTDFCDLTKKATNDTLLKVTQDQLKTLGQETVAPFTGG